LVGALQNALPPPAAPDQRLGELSPREREAAIMAGSGASNREIAAGLCITERTVKAHLSAAFAKLGVRDRLQLALLLRGSRPEH
jgi:DNA-binding CsgD family transcriptional regulator